MMETHANSNSHDHGLGRIDTRRNSNNKQRGNFSYPNQIQNMMNNRNRNSDVSHNNSDIYKEGGGGGYRDGNERTFNLNRNYDNTNDNNNNNTSFTPYSASNNNFIPKNNSSSSYKSYNNKKASRRNHPYNKHNSNFNDRRNSSERNTINRNNFNDRNVNHVDRTDFVEMPPGVAAEPRRNNAGLLDGVDNSSELHAKNSFQNLLQTVNRNRKDQVPRKIPSAVSGYFRGKTDDVSSLNIEGTAQETPAVLTSVDADVAEQAIDSTQQLPRKKKVRRGRKRSSNSFHWKPYSEMTWEERARRDQWETEKAEKMIELEELAATLKPRKNKRKNSKHSGALAPTPAAPRNTTLFLIRNKEKDTVEDSVDTSTLATDSSLPYGFEEDYSAMVQEEYANHDRDSLIELLTKQKEELEKLKKEKRDSSI
eukprot:Awhi_evm1s13077